MANPTELKIFTIDQANRAVKELRRTLPAMRRILNDVERMEDRLAVLELICNRSVSADNPDLQEYLGTKVRYHRRISEFEGMWSALEERGLLLRDLEKGIVHFASKRGSRDIFLCWREGEARVSHWHEPEEDFSDEDGRREIDREF